MMKDSGPATGSNGASWDAEFKRATCSAGSSMIESIGGNFVGVEIDSNLGFRM
jgi:hypothetical protein